MNSLPFLSVLLVLPFPLLIPVKRQRLPEYYHSEMRLSYHQIQLCSIASLSGHTESTTDIWSLCRHTCLTLGNG
ncbi:hypothetical protein K469DRAFT_98303 [Zopfia rhizophila CBS 207.26]|uniref:Secreted protein n=1 Tax=Zopfia rhizophila CBS 207.26 TaxID=1314779 RepID=A0A6A6E7T9_9PEZI|nr:hypothetical protein K469DRAFT_98303 [Zopfia rhizophila CBS 207.26]